MLLHECFFFPAHSKRDWECRQQNILISGVARDFASRCGPSLPQLQRYCPPLKNDKQTKYPPFPISPEDVKNSYWPGQARTPLPPHVPPPFLFATPLPLFVEAEVQAMVYDHSSVGDGKIYIDGFCVPARLICIHGAERRETREWRSSRLSWPRVVWLLRSRQ